MSKLVGFVIVIMCAMVSVSAQPRSERKQYVDDQNVSLHVEKIPTVEVNFMPRTSFSYPVDDFKPGVVRVGPRTTYLKEGLRIDEVVRLLGKPKSISERNERGHAVTSYEFQRAEGEVLVVDFEKGLLVHSQIESRAQMSVQADR